MIQIHAVFKKLSSNMILASWKWSEWVEEDVSAENMNQRVTGLDIVILLDKVDFKNKENYGGRGII